MDTNHRERSELVIQVHDPHTAIPDWLTFADISSAAYRTAAAMLASKPLPPTQDDLAARLGVDVRSIKRWQDELRTARLLTTYRMGRRWINVFHKPSEADRWQGDHLPSGRVIERSGMPRSPQNFEVIERSPIGDVQETCFVASGSGKLTKGDRSITSNVHGGGGGHHDLIKHDPPTPPNAPAEKRTKVRPNDITTATGRHMILEWRFSLLKAFALQHLDLEACKADYARRRADGQNAGAIINAWEVSPPQPRAAEVEQTGRLNAGELRRLYGDLFKGDDPREHLDRRDPDVNQFESECGL